MGDNVVSERGENLSGGRWCCVVSEGRNIAVGGRVLCGERGEKLCGGRWCCVVRGEKLSGGGWHFVVREERN